MSICTGIYASVVLAFVSPQQVDCNAYRSTTCTHTNYVFWMLQSIVLRPDEEHWKSIAQYPEVTLHLFVSVFAQVITVSQCPFEIALNCMYLSIQSLPHRKHCVSITKASRLMTFKEIIGFIYIYIYIYLRAKCRLQTPAHAGSSLANFLYPEDGGDTFLRNVG
jgi:hypothetical protein